jgi:hypothetical protein
MYSDNRITKPLNRFKSFRQVENEMRLSNIAYAACALAFGFALATPIPAYAQVGAQLTYMHRAHVHHLMAIPRTATALMPASATAVRAPETDGLSRNADDCAKFGCIDH